MTEQEHQGHDIISVLRTRLGSRYQAGADHGRAEIARVIASELKISRDEADTMTRELIDSGQIRYVAAVERDPDYDRDAQHDEHTDRDNRDVGLGIVTPDLDAGRDNRAEAVPGGGGPQTTAAGFHAGAAAPVAAAGTGAGVPGTLPAAAVAGAGGELGGDADDRGGYWEFGGGGGVVPSRSRKGQVEPRGT